MAWITPVTNWSASSYYNYGDLNRVENNISEVRTYLISIGYNVPSITANTSRSATSYDLISSINRIETNLNTVKNAMLTPPGWQSTITWDTTTRLSTDHANRWENSALQLYNLAQNIYAAYVYCGAFNSGGQEVLG